MLKPDIQNDSLDINIVFVNVINGERIASVFKKLGISQIFTFKQPTHKAKEGMISCESLDVMRGFTLQMIKRLVQ